MKFSNKDFVPFHCHTTCSHFDSIISPDKLALTAREMGFPAIAVTDHGNIQAWPSMLKHCKSTKDKKGNPINLPHIKSILGSEFYLSRSMNIGQYDKTKDKTEKTKKGQPDGRRGNRHLNLFALNFEGYKNICTLSQRSFTEGFYFDPRIDIDLLSKHSAGVMASTACLSGLVNVNLVYGRYDVAKNIAGILNEIFNKNFFLEIMYHGIAEQKEIIPDIFKMSSELNIPIVATVDSHYLKKEHADAQEVFMCMSQQKCVKDPKHLSFKHHEFYLKSAEEMGEIFGSTPEVIYNSVKMAERVDTNDIEKNLFGGMRLPKFDIPSEFKTPHEYMEKLAWEGMKRVGWENSTEHIVALKKELEDVRIAKENNNYDFATYFLIVMDYIQYARNNDIFLGPGRGSGYASVLLRCLGITYGIDPLIKGKLLWERFLGFDSRKFIKESDFGFEENIVQKIIETEVEEDDRELEDDLGGVDRY